jgi:hypothetical protein
MMLDKYSETQTARVVADGKVTVGSVNLLFQLGTALSIYGCSRFAEENVAAAAAAADMEDGAGYVVARGLGPAAAKPALDERDGAGEVAGFWGYLLQIIYQVKIIQLGGPSHVPHWRETSMLCTADCRVPTFADLVCCSCMHGGGLVLLSRRNY